MIWFSFKCYSVILFVHSTWFNYSMQVANIDGIADDILGEDLVQTDTLTAQNQPNPNEEHDVSDLVNNEHDEQNDEAVKLNSKFT